MAIMDMIQRRRFGLMVVAAMVAVVSLTTAPTVTYAQHHHGGDGISTGAAVGLGLGAFALGSALTAGAYGYPGYYAPPPAYPAYYPPPAYPAYYPTPAYYPPAPRSCWDSYSQRYYPC